VRRWTERRAGTAVPAVLELSLHSVKITGPRFNVKFSLLKQLFKFGIVGCINTAVDLGILNGLILLTGTGRSGLSYAAYQAIAFGCAMTNSYFLHRNWTFQRKAQKKQIVEGCQFLCVGIIGAVINVAAASYVATFVPVPAHLERYWPSLAAVVGTVFSFAFNFVGYKYFVFWPLRRNNQSFEHASQ
jgi:putative flippase GtrA